MKVNEIVEKYCENETQKHTKKEHPFVDFLK